MTPKKRGRPISERTIEKHRIKELLDNPPTHIRPMNEAERREIDSMLDSFEKAEKQILRQYRTSATIPKSHAYEMASLGDESLQGLESAIIARDSQYQMDASITRSKGGQARGNEPSFRAQKLAEINKDLIDKVNSGEISAGEAARLIHNRWQTRGLPSLRQPSQKTLERYISRAVSEE
jgi:hypothetical protein